MERLNKWFEIYKSQRLAIFRIKLALLIIVNVCFYFLIVQDLLSTFHVKDFTIKGNWLDIIINTSFNVLGYTLAEAELGIQLKMSISIITFLKKAKNKCDIY